MSNSQKKGRKAYLNNYKPKKGGGYEYIGKKYEYQGSEGFKKMLKKLWLLGGGAFVCMIASGCLTPPGASGSPYVVLPYAAGLVAGVSIVWALCRLSARGPSLETHVYEATIKALPRRGIAAMFFTAASLAGLAIYVFFNGFEQKLIHFLLFILFQILGMVLILFLYRYLKTAEWK